MDAYSLYSIDRAIVPILKIKRGNPSYSSNYSSITLSCLICKLSDTTIIRKTHEDNLESVDLQFFLQETIV